MRVWCRYRPRPWRQPRLELGQLPHPERLVVQSKNVSDKHKSHWLSQAWVVDEEADSYDKLSLEEKRGRR